MTGCHQHGEHPAQRGLHTFVPLPSASNPPTMVSHGGLPSRLIMNPEQNLRPMTVYTTPRSDSVASKPPNPVTTPCGTSVSHTVPLHPEPVADPHPEPRPLSDYPRAPTRTTIPVPVRSKQRSRMVDDPQPKKKHKAESESVSTVPISSRPDNPGRLPIDDDSDESEEADSYQAASTRARSDKATTDATRPAPISTTSKIQTLPQSL